VRRDLHDPERERFLRRETTDLQWVSRMEERGLGTYDSLELISIAREDITIRMEGVGISMKPPHALDGSHETILPSHTPETERERSACVCVWGEREREREKVRS
jgi:hypothetical protein